MIDHPDPGGNPADVAVIGAGIIGAATAYFLAREGARVLIVERDFPAAHSSGGAAGMLGVDSEESADPPLRAAALESRNLYRDLALLFAEIGVDLGLRLNGILTLPKDPPPAPLSRVTPSDGRFHPEDGELLASRAAEGFLRAALAGGATLESGRAVTGLLTTNAGVRGVMTDMGPRPARHVVVAAGPWSRSLLAPCWNAPPQNPVRGQLVILKPEKPLLPFPVIWNQGRRYLVPKADGTLLAGTTVEDAGFDERSTPEAESMLTEQALSLLPALENASLLGSWAGLRPGSPDAYPLVGPVPEHEGLWVATGHFRRGVLLAPWTGKRLAGAILRGGDLPERFLPARFHDPRHGGPSAARLGLGR